MEQELNSRAKGDIIIEGAISFRKPHLAWRAGVGNDARVGPLRRSVKSCFVVPNPCQLLSGSAHLRYSSLAAYDMRLAEDTSVSWDTCI